MGPKKMKKSIKNAKKAQQAEEKFERTRALYVELQPIARDNVIQQLNIKSFDLAYKAMKHQWHTFQYASNLKDLYISKLKDDIDLIDEQRTIIRQIEMEEMDRITANYQKEADRNFETYKRKRDKMIKDRFCFFKYNMTKNKADTEYVQMFMTIQEADHNDEVKNIEQTLYSMGVTRERKKQQPDPVQLQKEHLIKEKTWEVGAQSRINDAKAARNGYVAIQRKLRYKIGQYLEEDQKRLYHLSTVATKCINELNDLLNMAEKILRYIGMCSKYETEIEKTIPYSTMIESIHLSLDEYFIGAYKDLDRFLYRMAQIDLQIDYMEDLRNDYLQENFDLQDLLKDVILSFSEAPMSP